MAVHPNQWYIATGQVSGLSVDQNELVSTIHGFLEKNDQGSLDQGSLDQGSPDQFKINQIN